MIWRLLFIIGVLVFAVGVACVGASVWVLWDVLFPGRPRADDWMSREIEELLEAETRRS